MRLGRMLGGGGIVCLGRIVCVGGIVCVCVCVFCTLARCACPILEYIPFALLVSIS